MKTKTALIEFLGLVLGCIVMALGLNIFLKPHTIAPGGLSGTSVVLNKLTNIPVSTIMLLIGIPLVLFAYKILGKKNFLKTLLGTVIFSITVNLTSDLFVNLTTNDLLLSAIAGGILVGLGIGIVFSVDGSTGGTDLIALILSKKFPNLKTTRIMMILDGVVVISSGIVNQNLETALYSAIALFILIKVADIIMEGLDYSKAFFIISNESDNIRNIIAKELQRGSTILEGRGGYTDDRKDVLLVIIQKNQEVALKKLVKNIDPNAFVIVSDVHEVLGNGFKTLN